MELTGFQKKISALLPNIVTHFWEALSKHTSFRIGGTAEIMAFPKTVAELKELLRFSQETGCPYVVLGAGTNVLAPDEGVPGLVICLKDSMDGLERLENNRIRVAAGVTMTRLAVYAAGQGLGGLEFAHGIPGTVGGGVYMNAGAYGGEICQVLERAEVLLPNGELVTYSNADMKFSYRHSCLYENGGIVVSCVFALQEKPETEIRSQMQELMRRRSASQPLDLPSAGSAFKRPVGGYAAALIDEAGLKGYQVGNAGVSTKHAGFVVNLGNATAKDVKKVLSNVSDIVYERSGIRLEPEIRIW